MNKSIALFNLKLPQVVIDLICQFRFYTLSECIENTKQKYTKVIKEINYIERFQYYGYQLWHGIYYHIQINLFTTYWDHEIYNEINLGICTICNEFIKNSSKTKSLCKC